MRSFYKKYGRLVSFDLTFNLFKETPLEFDDKDEPVSKRSYQIGFFAGQNSHCNTIIFAVAITSSTKKADYQILIDTFVNLMGSPPETLVSDQDVALISCLETMKNEGKYSISHLYDSWHYLKSLKFTKKYRASDAKREVFHLINA